jgi:hypothetical protein
MTRVRMWAWIQAVVALVAVLSFATMAAEPPAEEVNRKPSTYAPAKDLESQVQFFLDRINNELKDESKYGEESVKRVVRDANTLAVLSLVLGKHDEANRFKSSAATLLQDALKLAEKSQDYKQAQSAYAKLVETTKTARGSNDLVWKSVGNIADLMNQVPILNTKLRGQVRSDKRFEKLRDEAAGLAATLAAIAHVSMFDDSYCSDQADQADWIELCGLMRDAAYDINQAVRRGDKEAAVSGLKPLTRSCDDCHEQFKD